jgi:hypothetical protein
MSRSTKGAAVQQPELPMKDVTPTKGSIKVGDTVTGPKPGHKAKIVAQATSKPKREKKSTAVAVAQPQAPKEIKSTLQVIAEISTNPNTRPEVAQMAWNMQKEMISDQRKMDFDAAFVALQADLSRVSIRQDGKIEIREKVGGERVGRVQQATPYSTFPNIMTTIQPLLTKHHFGLSFATEPFADGRILVRGFLTGYGHERTTAFPLPAETSGSKNNVQGWGSSQSYGKRYCAIALLNLVSHATVDADTDGHKGNFKQAKEGFAEVPAEVEKVSDDQAIKVREWIEWCGVSVATFCSHYGIKKVSDLPAEMFGSAEKSCKDYHANQQAKAKHG